MKQTLLKKNLIVKKLQFYLGIFALLLFTIYSPNVFGITHVTSLHKSTIEKTLTFNGNVTDQSTGQSMPGVTVKVKGLQLATVTDVKGNFTLAVPDNNATLVFSFIGYDSLELPVNGQTHLSIKMQESNKNLNEVVVIGYGTQKKTSLTSAISTINTAEIAQKPVVNLTNSLVGRASGLIVTQGSGEPGVDGSNIQIRGAGSVGSTQPLFIVDGVPRDFSRLDPNTIENISVLKDAAAVAVYGVAGANGVILVTTKKGKSGKPTLTYDGYWGIQNPTKLPTFVSSYQYALMKNEANANDFQPATADYTAAQLALYQNQSDPNAYPDSHPLQEIVKKNRPIYYSNLSLSGGNDDVRYFASFGYNHQDGMWDPTYLDKYNGSASITAKATKTTTVNLSVNSYEEDQHFPSQSAGTIINQAQRTPPIVPVYYTNGLWGGYSGQSLIGEIYHSGYQLNENTALLSQLSIDQKLPVKGLSIKGVVSYDSGPDPLFTGNQTSVQRIWTTPIPYYNINTNTTPYTYASVTQGSPKPLFTENYAQNRMLTYQGLLNYTGTFGKSDITGLLGVEDRTVKAENFSATRINYNLDIDELSFGGPAASDASNGGSSSGEKQLGYFYRIDYSYNKKYLFGAAGRYDGSYLFAPGHRFGFFPAFSAGWRISEEKFIKDNLTWVDNLKLRGSWGQSGAYPSVGGNIQTYQYLSPYNVYGTSAVINGITTQGINEALQGNPAITWEKANKSDVALEGSLWNGLLGFEVDYFYEKRSNMLVSIGNALPAEYGIGTGDVNGGIMQNQGIDLTLTTFKNFSNGLRLDVKGTFTYAKNKILKDYENAATYDNPNTRRTGRALGEQFGLKALGYFTNADFVDPTVQYPVLKPGIPVPTFGTVRPGDIQYADLNHDGKIDGNDQTDIGKPNTPQIIFGLEPRVTYKSFDIDVLLQGGASSSININNYFAFPFYGSGSATELSFNNHWTPTKKDALYPRLSATPTANNTQVSSWWERNTGYVRVKSLEFGYSFSTNLLGNSIKSLRVYTAAQNLFTWTPSIKEFFDPENSSGNQNYYQQQVISIGLNATF